MKIVLDSTSNLIVTLSVLAIGVDPSWRARMQRLLAAREDLHWLGAFAPAQHRAGASIRPTLLLLDGDDPGINRQRRCPLLPWPNRMYFYRRPDVGALLLAIQSHAHACLAKRGSPDALLSAVRAANAGFFVAAPGLMLQAMQDAPAQPADALDTPLLTGRQREVVHWTARGLSNKQIAQELGISHETVKAHLQQVFRTHGVHGRVALLASLQGPATLHAGVASKGAVALRH
jgi:DNA-binding NarL/FixJ family response regulator